MESLDLILKIMAVGVTPALTWIMLYIRNLNMKIDRLSKEIGHRPARTEVRQLVHDLNKPTEVVQQELKDDILRLEQKIDKLIEKWGK